MTTANERKKALKQAAEHIDCDKFNCFAGEDAWICIYARALIAEAERADQLRAEVERLKQDRADWVSAGLTVMKQPKPQSKDWCQGFCRTCGTSCAEYCEQVHQLRAELETERMKLAACGVAAMCNTKETQEKQRIGRDNPYWSASYQDVCSVVDREMQLREILVTLESENARLREAVADFRGWNDLMHDWARRGVFERHAVESACQQIELKLRNALSSASPPSKLREAERDVKIYRCREGGKDKVLSVVCQNCEHENELSDAIVVPALNHTSDEKGKK